MSSTTLDLTGQKAVTIGGTSGMGHAVARHVFNQAVAALSTHGKAVGLAAGLSDPVAVDRLRATLTEEHADAPSTSRWSSHRIRVNAVAPAVVRAPIYEEFHPPPVGPDGLGGRTGARRWCRCRPLRCAHDSCDSCDS